MNTVDQVPAIDSYQMVTAILADDGVDFQSEAEFKEALSVGFFRVKASDIDVRVGREFAKKFTADPRYTEFGILADSYGYLQSELNQTKRFTLERDQWDMPHPKDGKPNYPSSIQELGRKMNEVGIKILKTLLRKFELPENLWFQATAGSAHNEGSHNLLFNCYDPKDSCKPDGVAAHKDWSYITVLDAVEPGLKAFINGKWKDLILEDGYLTINFGYALEKLFPDVHASLHRVETQTQKMRTSTVVFIDPRCGPFRPHCESVTAVGYVYNWDRTKGLVNGIATSIFVKELRDRLFGENQK